MSNMLEQAFELWATKYSTKEQSCEYATRQGGSGYIGFKCTNSNHKDVKSYGKHCSSNCEHFTPCSFSKMWSVFMSLIHNHWSYYRDLLDISPNEIIDKDVLKAKQDNESRLNMFRMLEDKKYASN